MNKIYNMDELTLEFMKFIGLAFSYLGLILLFLFNNLNIKNPLKDKGVIKGKGMGLLFLTIGFGLQELSIIITWF